MGAWIPVTFSIQRVDWRSPWGEVWVGDMIVLFHKWAQKPLIWNLNPTATHWPAYESRGRLWLTELCWCSINALIKATIIGCIFLLHWELGHEHIHYIQVSRSRGEEDESPHHKHCFTVSYWPQMKHLDICVCVPVLSVFLSRCVFGLKGNRADGPLFAFAFMCMSVTDCNCLPGTSSWSKVCS